MTPTSRWPVWLKWPLLTDRELAAHLEDAELATKERLDQLISRVANDEELKEILATLQKRRGNLHIKPEFTPIVVGACQQILAFGAAGLAILATFSGRIVDLQLPPAWVKALSLAAIFYFDLILVSLVTLIWFFLQARSRYPFLFLKEFGNTIPYFYYETLSREHRWWPLPTRGRILKANRLYLADFQNYVVFTLNEDLKTQLEVELKQSFLLIVYQGYLDQYEMQLVHIFLYGAISAVMAVGCLLMFI